MDVEAVADSEHNRGVKRAGLKSGAGNKSIAWRMMLIGDASLGAERESG